MRDKWSLLVVTLANGYGSSHNVTVLDFASPAWAETAYDNLKFSSVVDVVKLY